MPRTIERKKWILYRHTNNLDLLTAVAVNLRFFSKTAISKEDKMDLLLELKNLGYYKERNPELPLDAISHKINEIEYYFFGYQDNVGGEDKFLFGPLGNLFLKNFKNKKNLRKVFFSMLWGVQFPNNFGTDPVFKLYPFRLVFKLLLDERLDYMLYAFEVAYLVVFVEDIDEQKYEKLVNEILKMRKLSDGEIEKKFKEDEHVYVNATYEWDYYVSELFASAGVLDKTNGKVICTLIHGKDTPRKLTRNYVVLNDNVKSLCNKLQTNFPFDSKPLQLDDSERLKIDVVKEIYGFYPEALLEEIGEEDYQIKLQLLNLPKLIEKYSENEKGEGWELFEDTLVRAFNLFYNVRAKGIGGAGKTDVECLYITKKKKFAVDGKSTKNKLSGLNAGRLASHRERIGAEYTIVVTPRYVPAVLQDIKSSPIVIVGASTFSEYLSNHIDNDVREIDYIDFDSIITQNLGTDISRKVSDFTIEKFASKTK